jgi:hypothetical protein
MHKKTIDTILSILMGISALIMVIGATFKILHYSDTYLLFHSGVILYIFLSTIESLRLHKEIKSLKKIIETTDKEKLN